MIYGWGLQIVTNVIVNRVVNYILYYFRRAAMNDKYVVKCEEPFKKYKIMALSGVRGRSPRLVEDKVYPSVTDAYHGLFLRRVQDLMEA